MLSDFILMHTQRGKTAYTKQLVQHYIALDPTYLPFFVLDNNTALAVQTQQALEDLGTCLALHSLGNTNEREIITHINLHSHDHTMLIMCLDNTHQIPRMARIMQHAKNIGYKPLLVVDEADKTYPHCRPALYSLTDRWIFVSATIGSLKQYPECIAAIIKHAPIPSPVWNAEEAGGSREVPSRNRRFLTDPYRGILSNGSVTSEYGTDGYKEDSALQCIRDNRNYFFSQVTCADGVTRYRKVLIHGSSIPRMVELAKTLASDGWGVVCVFGVGTFAVKDGEITGGVKNRKISVNQSIAALVQQYQLDTDRPLAVIGNRKMDRGITYHNFNDGIIFTDCLLGHVKNTDTAVQKAGRLAGNIASLPQFHNALNWFANANTLQRILEQCHFILNATSNKPLSTSLNLQFNIIGPFSSYTTLKKHKHMVIRNNRTYITHGATLYRQSFNISLSSAITLASQLHQFAAVIHKHYYIIIKN